MSELRQSPRGANPDRRKLFAAIFVNVALFALIGATFFFQDYRYSLPTPKPAGFRPPDPNQIVTLPGQDRRLTLLCFASPDCDCSKFNQDHLWAIAHEFGKRVRIVEVIESADRGGLDSPEQTLLDADGKLAKQCGVYSTPQAVVVNHERHIAYSGNFNAARYCANSNTQFARLALEALIAGEPVPPMPKSATIPYGCVIASEVKSK